MDAIAAHPTSLPPRRRRAYRGAVAAVLAVGIGLVLLAGGRGRAQVDGPETNRLVHWQRDGRDWLLVADRSTHELVVYDAASGEPLQRLGADDGLGQVDAIAQFGDRLLVRKVDGPSSLLTLPGLRPAALASR